MEVVRSGSRQNLPGCEDYDSGVDDLQNPRIYVVWTMNMNTHIYPEFVVSFKISSKTEGHLIGSETKLDISGVTSCQVRKHQQLEPSAVDLTLETSPQEQQHIDSDNYSLDCDGSFLDGFSNVDSWSDNEEITNTVFDEDNKLSSLMSMGYTRDKASIAMERCAYFSVM
ncbi:uncharacterized protein LOC142636953 [Castanea sativa]|uniref:uncharacterized protein LOC142636953 n=1 Tax=Castanea sativa TaxID=21020 RepID=UPI003F64BDA4